MLGFVKNGSGSDDTSHSRRRPRHKATGIRVVLLLAILLGTGLALFIVIEPGGETGTSSPTRNPEIDEPRSKPGISRIVVRAPRNPVEVSHPESEAKEQDDYDEDESYGFATYQEEDEPEGASIQSQKSLTAFLFISLPFDELKKKINDTGFDKISWVKGIMSALASLRDAIRYGDAADIKIEAREFLRLASFLDTKESDFHKEYLAVRRQIKRRPNGRKDVKFIKSVMISAYDYAKILSSY